MVLSKFDWFTIAKNHLNGFNEDAANPTAYIMSILITGANDAQEGHDFMMGDVPNAYTSKLSKEKREQ